MEKLSKIESFKSFGITKQSMSQISGSRTVEYQEVQGGDGGCAKIIDSNDEGIRKIKVTERYEGRC